MIPKHLAAAHSVSSPFYLYSMRSKSIEYWNLPFPANSDQEAILRIRQTVNSPGFDKSTLSDLEIYRVGCFLSIDQTPLVGLKKPVLVVGDLFKLLDKEVKADDLCNSIPSSEDASI